MDWAEVIPVICVFSIPIIAILTAHQRKMTELIHGSQKQQADMAPLMHEIQSLRQEVSDLRQKQNEQLIALDDLRSGGSVQERLDQTS